MPLLAAAALAVATAGLAGCSNDDGGDAADPPPPLATMAWSDVRVPWVDGELVHFGDATMPQPEQLASVAATADSALVQTADSLTELAADGTQAALGKRVAGIPLADPAGHLAAWTESGAPGSFRLVAYDTAAHEVAASIEVEAGVFPFAVDDGTVYFGDGNSFTRTWEPAAGSGPADLAVPDDTLLLDATPDHRFFIGAEQSTLLSTDGESVEGFGETLFGGFDPSGDHLALTDRESLRVWDIAAGADVALALPDDVVFDTLRWDPDGMLVVRTSPVPDGDAIPPDSPVEYLACDIAERRCGTLPTEIDTVEQADGLESSGSGQLLGLLG